MTQLAQPLVYHLYACLPFVELAHESSIRMGPLIFWPASKYEEFLPSEDQEKFKSYLQSISEVKTRNGHEHEFITTVKLAPEGTTCISIDEDVDPQEKEFLLIDALYLLYFACNFRNLYYQNEVFPFDVFRKIIPASLEFIENKKNWEHLYINENRREETVCVHLFDQNICLGFGKMLSAIYHKNAHPVPSASTLDHYKRVIRSIRYLVDRFIERFVNLFGKGLDFPEALFEPEDVIFLASSFEALFDISDRHPDSDFKQKVRPVLHLKYSQPVDLFWMWVDDFYSLRRKIVHGGVNPDPIFRGNPNFEISHLALGIKLFIYSVYYYLFKYHLLSSETFDPYTPPDFKWIHPEEVLLFFWTEKSLLHQLHELMKGLKNQPNQQEVYADIRLLANLFIFMHEHHDTPKQVSNVGFIPCDAQAVNREIKKVLTLIEAEDMSDEEEALPLLKHLPPEFKVYLAKQLSSELHSKH